MQLTPSLTTDPNLLALLFPGAGAPTATGDMPGAAGGAATAGFDALFASLTTASPGAAAPGAAPLVPDGGTPANPLGVALVIPPRADTSGRPGEGASSPALASETLLPGEEQAAVTEPARELPAYRATPARPRSPRAAPALADASEGKPEAPGAAALEAAAIFAGQPPVITPEEAPVREDSTGVFPAEDKADEQGCEERPAGEAPLDVPRAPVAERALEPRVSHLHGMRWIQPATPDNRSASSSVSLPTPPTEPVAGVEESGNFAAVPPVAGAPAPGEGEGRVRPWEAEVPSRARTGANTDLPRTAEALPLAPTFPRMPFPLRGVQTADTPSGETSAPVPAGLSSHASGEVVALATAAMPVVESPVRARTLRTAGGPESEEANFAALAERISETADGTENEADRSFVGASPQRVAKRNPSLGTGVANAEVAMSSRATLTPPSQALPEYGEVVREIDRASDAGNEFAMEALPAAADAHRAVEVVLHAVDRVAAAGQKSVKLEFSVGDADLEVRVELRDDEVRTTFRTDSADLRAALAQEWQGVASASPGSLRLAPAVITESREAGLGSSFGDAAGQHGRQSAQSQDGSPAHAQSARAGLASRLPAAESATPELLLPRFAPAGTALRLNLFA